MSKIKIESKSHEESQNENLNILNQKLKDEKKQAESALAKYVARMNEFQIEFNERITYKQSIITKLEQDLERQQAELGELEKCKIKLETHLNDIIKRNEDEMFSLVMINKQLRNEKFTAELSLETYKNNMNKFQFEYNEKIKLNEIQIKQLEHELKEKDIELLSRSLKIEALTSENYDLKQHLSSKEIEEKKLVDQLDKIRDELLNANFSKELLEKDLNVLHSRISEVINEQPIKQENNFEHDEIKFDVRSDFEISKEVWFAFNDCLYRKTTRMCSNKQKVFDKLNKFMKNEILKRYGFSTKLSSMSKTKDGYEVTRICSFNSKSIKCQGKWLLNIDLNGTGTVFCKFKCHHM